ncbi:MAG: 50S ribosomal protein L15 [Candidatus Marinimicrobia bacterium]|nr:50S ribosomal protein L15 [Candidatus Neomarinimicrobiota bacterium]MDD5581845.1 50S ribosomal protein L15 [Candidatus Neomarinimicrobiota bacterium]
MILSTLKPAQGSRKNSKRRGKGIGSGNGCTAGRGTKGQKSRTGSKHYSWFEGGQMPLQRRVPKRGFSNDKFRQEYQIVNLKDLNILDEKDVNAAILKANGLIKKEDKPVKILGVGEVDKAFNVTVDAFSASAKEKIEKAGGKAIEL